MEKKSQFCVGFWCFFVVNLKKKTNLQKGKMSLSVYTKGDYEEFCGFGRRKNKANSKPNKLVLSVVEWRQLPAFGRKF